MGRHALDVARAGIPGVDLSFLVGHGPLHEALSDAGASIAPESSRFIRGSGTGRSLASLRAAIDGIRPALVHSHLSRADFLSALGTPRGIPLVSTEHGIADVPRLYNANPLVAEGKRRLHQVRLRRTAGVIAVSHATKRSIEAQWRPPSTMELRVVHNGIDPQPPHALRPTTEHRIGVLSRLSHEKRIDLAIEALAILIRDHRGATLSIAGTGDEEGPLRRLVSDRGLDGHVDFVGHVDAAPFLEGIDLLVQLSAWENCSYSLLDAVAASKGVVATDVGGNAEILPSSSLVPSEATPAEIALAIDHNLDRPLSLDPVWPTVDQMTAGIARFYDDILDRRPSR
jgi:glycosyltransferase involved in cell wall biosynthesis